MQSIEKRHRIIALLFTILFVSYYGGSSFFYHVHYVNNVAVVHSHPYSGGHTHSAASFQTISILNAIVLTTINAVAAVAVFRLLLGTVGKRIFNHIYSVSTHLFRLRAPPVF